MTANQSASKDVDMAEGADAPTSQTATVVDSQMADTQETEVPTQIEEEQTTAQASTVFYHCVLAFDFHADCF